MLRGSSRPHCQILGEERTCEKRHPVASRACSPVGDRCTLRVKASNSSPSAKPRGAQRELIKANVAWRGARQRGVAGYGAICSRSRSQIHFHGRQHHAESWIHCATVGADLVYAESSDVRRCSTDDAPMMRRHNDEDIVPIKAIQIDSMREAG